MPIVPVSDAEEAAASGRHAARIFASVTPTSGLAVACRRVVHIYRAGAVDVVALAGVDLSIAPGETLAMVGPSGSGKCRAAPTTPPDPCRP